MMIVGMSNAIPGQRDQLSRINHNGTTAGGESGAQNPARALGAVEVEGVLQVEAIVECQHMNVYVRQQL